MTWAAIAGRVVLLNEHFTARPWAGVALVGRGAPQTSARHANAAPEPMETAR